MNTAFGCKYGIGPYECEGAGRCLCAEDTQRDAHKSHETERLRLAAMSPLERTIEKARGGPAPVKRRGYG